MGDDRTQFSHVTLIFIKPYFIRVMVNKHVNVLVFISVNSLETFCLGRQLDAEKVIHLNHQQL